jgi:5-carboxymethyl-2-hydroxymuconate isomerase
MPHLVILYTKNLDAEADIGALCRTLADTMLAQRDDAGTPVFPPGGTRVLAYPAAHGAVADGRHDYAFMYMNLRMARGRSEAVQRRVGEALAAAARAQLAALFERRYIGLTVQVDEGHEVFDAKASTIHPLFGESR